VDIGAQQGIEILIQSGNITVDSGKLELQIESSMYGSVLSCFRVT